MRPVSVGFGKRKQASEGDNQRRADMATIYVKCKPGRRHFYEGRVIPTDEFIPVDGNDSMMQRAIYVWGDLEVEGGAGEGSKPGDPIDPPGHASGQPIRDTINPQRTPRRRARADDPPLIPEHQPVPYATPKE